jgi:hypothetical protein
MWRRRWMRRGLARVSDGILWPAGNASRTKGIYISLDLGSEPESCRFIALVTCPPKGKASLPPNLDSLL